MERFLTGANLLRKSHHSSIAFNLTDKAISAGPHSETRPVVTEKSRKVAELIMRIQNVLEEQTCQIRRTSKLL